MDNYKEVKKKKAFNRPITTLLISLSFMSIILLTMMFGSSPKKINNKNKLTDRKSVV